MPGTEVRRTVRDAVPADGAVCAAIYTPYVTDTAVSFETVPPDDTEMARRISEASTSHAFLVIEDEGTVVGYAYGGPYRTRDAYRWACEVSIYLAKSYARSRSGAGRELYEVLLARLADRGFRTVLAGMTLPNEPSAGFHRAMGFEPVGVYRGVGWKHGAWHDVAWTQRPLSPGGGAPAELR